MKWIKKESEGFFIGFYCSNCNAVIVVEDECLKLPRRCKNCGEVADDEYIRRRLVKLIMDAPKTDTIYGGIKLPKPVQTANTIADHLLANGVIVLPMPMTDSLRAELEEYCYRRCIDEL